jgi:hypothetical protein
MAIAVEGTPSYGNVAATGYTAETTGSDRLLVILVSCEDGATPDVTTFTFGSASLAGGTIGSAVQKRNSTAGFVNTSIFYIKQANIPAGSNTPSIAYDSGALTAGPYFDYFTLSGVDQTTPTVSTGSDSIDNVSSTTFPTGITLTTSSGGYAIALAATNNANTYSAWDDFSEAADDSMSAGAYRRGVATVATTGASVFVNPTFSSTTQFGAMAAAAFKPAAGSTPTAALAAAYYYNR